MSYQIYDSYAAIKFVRDGKESLIYKSFIKKIAVVREDIIKIEMNCCMDSICFRYRDVNDPVTSEMAELINMLNIWTWLIYHHPGSA